MVLEPISRQKGAATGRAGRGSAEIFDSVYNMIRFKYRFGPQPLDFVSNWSLTFQLCRIGPQPFNHVSK